VAIESVQALRFIAAMLVVITHVTNFINERIHGHTGDYWKTGLSGVDIFFVISGFVMAYTSNSSVNQTWRDFLRKRFLRVVPLYWLATMLKVILVAVFAKLANHSLNDPQHILASLLFIPWPNADNEYLPVIPAGWTLNYEIFYYLIFACALLIRRTPLIVCASTFIALYATTLDTEAPDVIRFYGNPIVFEFILGMLTAQLATRPNRGSYKYLGPILAFTGATFILLVPPSDWILEYRWAAWGFPSMAIVLGLILTEKTWPNFAPHWLVKLGDSSYSLYLFHAMAIPATITIFSKLNVHTDGIFFIASCMTSVAFGHLVHLSIEKPMTRFLRSWANKGKRNSIQA